MSACERCGDIKPYYDQDGITIYHGDFRDVLPAIERPDVLVVDPVWPNATIPLVGSDDPVGTFRAMWDALPELPLRAAVQLGCDSDPRFLAAVPDALAFFRVCWLEMAQTSYKGRLLNSGDIGYLFGPPPPACPGRMVIPGKILDPNPKGRQSTKHPCPRKLRHVEWQIAWWSQQSDLIVDPCVGSGTTLRAAKNLGRRAIGIDIVESFCEEAANRMAQSVMDLEQV